MTKSPKRRGAIVATGALIGGLALVAAAFVIGPNLTPKSPAAIQVFDSLSSFSAASRVRQTITFDGIATGISGSNPTSLGRLNVLHSTAATFRTEGAAYVPVSSPNVLAPFGPDATLVLGDTTLTFTDGTHSAGFFLIIPRGSNQDAIWTSTVEADTSDRSSRITVTFQGILGEQRFIGFRSGDELVSISFGPAIRADASAVLALDDIVVD